MPYPSLLAQVPGLWGPNLEQEMVGRTDWQQQTCRACLLVRAELATGYLN